MEKVRMKPQGYSKLTKDEKEALLIAVLNQHDPIPAIEKDLTQKKEELKRLVQEHGPDSPQVRKWKNHINEIEPLLNNVILKLDKSRSRPWIIPFTKLDSIEELYEELFLLAENEKLSIRSKGIGAFLLIQLYMDEELMKHPNLQKDLIHQRSKANDYLFGELKSTVTKSLMELPKFHTESFIHNDKRDRKKDIRTQRIKDKDRSKLESLLHILESLDLSWQAKGTFLYRILYPDCNPIFFSIMSPNSSIEKGYAEVDEYIHRVVQQGS